MTVEVIMPDQVVKVHGAVMQCGHCHRGIKLPRDEVLSGQEVQCPHCHRFQWFTVENFRVTVHPGERPKPSTNQRFHKGGFV